MLWVWDHSLRTIVLACIHSVYAITYYCSKVKNVTYLFVKLEFGLAQYCLKPGGCWLWLSKFSQPCSWIYLLGFDVNIAPHLWVYWFLTTLCVCMLCLSGHTWSHLKWAGPFVLCLPLEPPRANCSACSIPCVYPNLHDWRQIKISVHMLFNE